MPEIKIDLKQTVNNSYKVFIGKNLDLAKELKKGKFGQKYCIVTDSITLKLFGNSLLKYLRKNDIEAELVSFQQGEKFKTLKTIETLAEEMIKKGFSRKDAIIALGGGVVGDLAGFLASIFQRGMPYIQVPTTLLAMVDSAIGGKTGVDLKAGKNLLGTITQAKAVFIDTNYLKTLPINQIRSGLAEIIKYGIIQDAKLFKFIEDNTDKILKLDEKAINYIIKRSVEIKAELIQKDEKEAGKRMILNYGHTYGHALEKLSNFTLLHGYAISIGMVIVNKIAVEKGLLKVADAERIKKLFIKVGLPVTTMKKLSNKDIKNDKKRDGDYINLVFATKIGAVTIYKEKCL